MKDIVQLRQRSDQELKDRLNDVCVSLQRARSLVHRGADFFMASHIKGDTMFARKLRREKAQILTILRERELKRIERIRLKLIRP
jgi:ribosomal protein L29